MENHSTINYDQITENIWIGNNMCCTVHASELHKLGFDADIDLEDKRPEEPPHTKIYLWLPTPDHTPSTQAQLKVGVAALKALVEQNLKIYVHCQNGHGRGPTLVAAYLASEGKTVEEAFDFIKSKRSTVHFEETQIQSVRNLIQK